MNSVIPSNIIDDLDYFYSTSFLNTQKDVFLFPIPSVSNSQESIIKRVTDIMYWYNGSSPSVYDATEQLGSKNIIKPQKGLKNDPDEWVQFIKEPFYNFIYSERDTIEKYQYANKRYLGKDFSTIEWIEDSPDEFQPHTMIIFNAHMIPNMEALLFNLKSWRDTDLIRPIFIGEDFEKLKSLVTSGRVAFYASQVKKVLPEKT